MKNKKIGRLIKAGILMFYIVSCTLILFVLEDNQEDKFRSTLSHIIGSEYVENIARHFDDIEIDSKEKSDEVAYMFMHYYANRIRGYIYNYNRPFSLAIQDREGNITYLHDNFFYWQLGDEVCVGLDEYLTDEIRKELKTAEKGKYNALVEELQLYFDGEKYIPVEVKFRPQADFYEDKRITVKFTDYEPNKIIENNPYAMGTCLFELETKFYNRPYYPKLKEDINSEYERLKDAIDQHFGAEFGAPGFGGSPGDWVGSFNLAIGDGYRVYFAFRYNSYLVTFFSEEYQTVLITLAILFAVVGLIFYMMCMQIITKNEKLEEAKSTFISAASHELKTPLAVIQNQCECIIENIAPEKNGEYVSSIYDEAVRMNSIVTSLLSYNKISQLTDIKKERCNLSELLKEEVKRYRRFAEKEGVSIEESIADEIYISCNAPLMKMAIDNYLSNAVKYAVGDKKITVSLSENRGVFNLTVMNPAERESVNTAQESWREFSRGDKSRQRKGTSVGMGLPICKKIFELHSFSGFCKYSEGMVSFVIIG